MSKFDGPADIEAVKRFLEKLPPKPLTTSELKTALASEPTDEFEELENQIKKADSDRRNAEAESAKLLERRLVAKKLIKKLSEERLAKADKLQDFSKAKEVFFNHFIMGGKDGKVKDFIVRPGVNPTITCLYEDNVLMAVRIEQNPLFPVFLLIQQTDNDQDLKNTLVKYMKAFAVVSPQTLEQINRI